MTWTTDAPRSAPASSEPQLRMLHPRVRYLWWVQGALSVLQIGVPVGLLDWAVPHPAPSGLITAGAVALLVVIAVVVPPVRYRRWRYALREEDLWIRHGVLTITVTVVPYRRLQFVDTKQGPLDRLFGLSQLMVHTAAIGTSAKLPGLAVDDAERLREALAQLEPDDAAI